MEELSFKEEWSSLPSDGPSDKNLDVSKAHSLCLGDRLSQLVGEQGITQQELAKRAGITPSAVSLYMQGKRTPTASTLEKLATALGTTPDFLLHGSSQACSEDIAIAKLLLSRNIRQMTMEQKMEVMEILL